MANSLAALLLLGALQLSAQSARGQANPPNIVVLVADDLGWRDVGYHGGEVKTPHIDRLAKEGVRLERFYVAPICSPTRAGLMTGRYPIRYGSMRAVYPPWRKGGLDPEEVTIAESLAKAGYAHRGAFGKWHLGHSSVKYHSLRHGFTEFVGHYNGAIDYFTHEREGELDWHHDYEPLREPGYSTDLIAAHAARFIEKRGSGTDPFLCYVTFNAVHSPFQAKPDDRAPYRDLDAVPGNWRAPLAERRKKRQALLAVAGLRDHGGKPLDGINALGRLTNRAVATPEPLARETSSYIGQNGPAREQIFCMTTVWKLIVIGPAVNNPKADESQRRKLLYRIRDDPNERANVAAEHPDVVAQLYEKIRSFRALQPEDAVPPYSQGRQGFKPPKDWAPPDISNR